RPAPGYRDRERRERQRELDAAVAVEEALRPMDDGDCVEHDDRDAEGSERREESHREQHPAGLAEAGEHGQEDRRAKAEVLEEPSRPANTVAAEPTEQLLRAVRGDREPADDT